MKFVFDGKYEEFLRIFTLAMLDINKMYLVNGHPTRSELYIGITGKNHSSGGRWFTANVKNEDDKTIITGFFNSLKAESSKSISNKIIGNILFILLYITIIVIPYIILFGIAGFIFRLFGYTGIIAPLILCTIILLLSLLIIKMVGLLSEKRTDNEFVQFMINKVGCKLSD